ncbi:hypothetical protein BKA62DRAFT_237656 [Auriculariales sp. MPI-PUGE-AT-0066]|nr:hypothetical protein BKA62DRAFT_237656 [Auriculariales sp. MPI-PUGE-AT-0066]
MRLTGQPLPMQVHTYAVTRAQPQILLSCTVTHCRTDISVAEYLHAGTQTVVILARPHSPFQCPPRPPSPYRRQRFPDRSCPSEVPWAMLPTSGAFQLADQSCYRCSFGSPCPRDSCPLGRTVLYPGLAIQAEECWYRSLHVSAWWPVVSADLGGSSSSSSLVVSSDACRPLYGTGLLGVYGAGSSALGGGARGTTVDRSATAVNVPGSTGSRSSVCSLNATPVGPDGSAIFLKLCSVVPSCVEGGIGP